MAQFVGWWASDHPTNEPMKTNEIPEKLPTDFDGINAIRGIIYMPLTHVAF